MRDFIDKEKRSTIMETSKIERLRDMKKNEEKQQETAKEKMSRKKTPLCNRNSCRNISCDLSGTGTVFSEPFCISYHDK